MAREASDSKIFRFSAFLVDSFLKTVQLIEFSVAAMQAISLKEKAEIRKNSKPEELADQRKKSLKRKGPKVLRDARLAPLTIGTWQHGPLASKNGWRIGFDSIGERDPQQTRNCKRHAVKREILKLAGPYRDHNGDQKDCAAEGF